MPRILRWIVVLAALAVLGMAGLQMVAWLDARPHDHRELWLEGPADARIRGDSWFEGGSWMDDPREVHEYTLVAFDGSETRIGTGPAALDSPHVQLYEHGEQAELVVEDTSYRRTASGSWARFRATDRDFIHRHYTPLTELAVRRREHSWRYRFTGVRCQIVSVELDQNRLVSSCGDPRRVRLVFRRTSPDDSWALDEQATLEETPPPERIAFPARARATISVVRAFPAKDLFAIPEVNQRLAATLREPGAELVQELELELVGNAPVEVEVSARGFQQRWPMSGGWMTPSGWPVVFWEDYELRSQPWGEAALVYYATVPREGASYLVYLELEEP